MKKNGWTIEILEERLDLLKNLALNEKDGNKLNMLLTDYEFVKYYIYECLYPDDEELPLYDAYKEFKKDLTACNFSWSDIINFYYLTKSDIGTIPELQKIDLTEDDLFELTHDFYKSLNGDFYISFARNFIYRKHYTSFELFNPKNPCGGETIPIISQKEFFMKIYRDFTLDDLFTTVHEYSHTTSITINPNNIDEKKVLFEEIESIFMELIAADYFENIFKNGEALLTRAIYHNKYCSTAHDIKRLIPLISFEGILSNGYCNKNTLINAAEAIQKVSSLELAEILKKEKYGKQKYLISYMFAIELYNLYKRDKEIALYYLRKIILLNCSSSEEYYNSIKKMGLDPNFSTEQIHKACKEDIMRITRKKSNQK